MVGVDNRVVLGLTDGHPRAFAEQLGQRARVVSLEVLDHDEDQPAVGWQK